MQHNENKTFKKKKARNKAWGEDAENYWQYEQHAKYQIYPKQKIYSNAEGYNIQKWHL